MKWKKCHQTFEHVSFSQSHAASRSSMWFCFRYPFNHFDITLGWLSEHALFTLRGTFDQNNWTPHYCSTFHRTVAIRFCCLCALLLHLRPSRVERISWSSRSWFVLDISSSQDSALLEGCVMGVTQFLVESNYCFSASIQPLHTKVGHAGV